MNQLKLKLTGGKMNNKFLQMLKMKNNKILQPLKKYISKQEYFIDLDILKTEILLLFQQERKRRQDKKKKLLNKAYGRKNTDE